MKVIGLDIAFSNIGVSLFEDNGSKIKFIDGTVIVNVKKKFVNKKKMSQAENDVMRILHIQNKLDEFIKKNNLKGSKVFCACEYPHGGSKSSRASRTMGIATGIMATYLNCNGFIQEIVKPSDSKKSLTGDKNASKKKMMKYIRNKKLIDKVPDNIKNKKGLFEHFADSIGAVLHVRKNSNLYKYMIAKEC